MTVAENVDFPLMIRGVPKTEREPKVKDALRLIRMEGLEDRYPRQLSGGQQQRVGLARALVSPACAVASTRLSIWTPSCARRCASRSRTW